MTDEKKDYKPSVFLETLSKRTVGHPMPACPFCGNRNYSTPQEMAAIFVSTKFQGIKIGPTVPCGMVICKECGHVDFFALGILEMLPSEGQKEEGKNNGQ